MFKGKYDDALVTICLWVVVAYAVGIGIGRLCLWAAA